MQYYCYNNKCPIRTKEQPWPRSDGEYKSTKIISRNGKSYYRKEMVCKHCGEIMTKTISLSELDE